MRILVGFTFLMVTAGNVLAAEDQIYLEETVISGNQELPKVLYILPWRDMPSAGLDIRQLETPDVGVLTPVYPYEHRRELRYRQSLEQLQQSQESPVTSTDSNP